MFRRKKTFFLVMLFQKKKYFILKQNLKPFFVSWVNVFSVFNIIILKWWKNDYSLVLMLWKFLTTVCDMSLEHEVSRVYKSSAILFYTTFFFLQTIKELEEWICFCYKHNSVVSWSNRVRFNCSLVSMLSKCWSTHCIICRYTLSEIPKVTNDPIFRHKPIGTIP